MFAAEIVAVWPLTLCGCFYVGFVLVGEIELKAVAGEYFVAAGRCAVDGRSGVVVAVACEEVFYFGGDGGYHGVVPAVADSERQEFL